MENKDFLFSTEKNGRVLLTIGESCPSNCFNCNNRFLGKKYYSYKELKDNIDFLGNNFSKNFECLLFFTDSIYHPDVLKFVGDQILSSFEVFTLQIHPKFNEKFEKISKKILEINPRVVFHVCNFFLNKDNFSELKDFFINVLNIKSDFDVDLFFNFSKYKLELEELMKLFPWNINLFYDINGKKAIKLDYKNLQVNFYFQAEQNIYDSKKYISNIHYKSCISYSSFSLYDRYINIYEEVMILPNGNITFHRNTMCSKAIKKISSIKKDNSLILNDFKKLSKDLSKYNNGRDMGFNCYSCINNKINYE